MILWVLISIGLFVLSTNTDETSEEGMSMLDFFRIAFSMFVLGAIALQFA